MKSAQADARRRSIPCASFTCNDRPHGVPRAEVGRLSRRSNDSLTKLIVTDPQYCMLRAQMINIPNIPAVSSGSIACARDRSR